MAPTKRSRPSDFDDDDYNDQQPAPKRYATRSSSTRHIASPRRTTRSRPGANSEEGRLVDRFPDHVNEAIEEASEPVERVVSEDVLSTSNISSESQQIFQRNQTASRLLALPSEVRNRIFELVIGSNTYHVWSTGKQVNGLASNRKLARSACRREESEKQEAVNIKAAHDTEQQDGYHIRHAACNHANQHSMKINKKSNTGMNLALVLTCRQIHNETALLPYHNNTFSFEWIIDLEAFIKHLVPTQVAAVQNIAFLFHQFQSDEVFEEMLQKQLSGLKSLVVFAQFHGGHGELDMGVSG